MGQIPQRLIQGMAEVSSLPEVEQDALASAIVNAFGPCMCQQTFVTHGHRVFIEMCAGHQFLIEDDRACTRIQHLCFGRAMSGKWLLAEFGHSGLLQRAVDGG